MGQETGNYQTDIFSPEELNKYPVTLGEGGDIVGLPKFEVKASDLSQGSVFDLYPPTGFSRSDLGFGAATNTTLGGSSLTLPQPGGTGSQYASPLPASGKEQWTNIYNQELARLNEIRAKSGQPPVSLADKMPGSNQTVGEYLISTADKGFELQTQMDASQAAMAARNAAGGQTGIPLVLPLPIDPITGLIITGAGLIASGGNVAKLDPSNPIGSLTGAVQGTINTIGSIPGQIAGAVGIGSTAGTGTTAGSGAVTGTGEEPPSGTILVPPGAIGGNSGNSGTTPSDTGTNSTGGSIPVIGTGGDIKASGTESTATGTGTQTQPSDNEFWNKVLGGVVSTQQTNQPPSQRIGGLTGEQPKDGTVTIFNPPTTNPPTTKPPTTKPPTDNPPKTDPPVVTPPTTKPPTDNPPKTNPPVVTPPVTNPPTTTPPSTSFPIVYGTSTSSYTPMATTVYQRNLPKELSTSTSALFGQIPLVNAQGQPTGGSTDLLSQYNNIYQNFLNQTAIPQAAQQSLTQLGTDAQRLARIQSGELSSEDIRNSQQAAREAYGARGQVMAPGAIGAEILNREAIRQQRENEARAGYQSSMQNVFNAAQLQTGNIFSPIGSLVSSTFNPLAPYEADVYGTNVNALNAEQIAAANRQAALEAAKLGQTGTYANALGTFLGSPTGNTVLKSVWDYFSGGGNTSGTGKV